MNISIHSFIDQRDSISLVLLRFLFKYKTKLQNDPVPIIDEKKIVINEKLTIASITKRQGNHFT